MAVNDQLRIASFFYIHNKCMAIEKKAHTERESTQRAHGLIKSNNRNWMNDDGSYAVKVPTVISIAQNCNEEKWFLP